jgi:magnesium chelatase family protein
VHIDVPAVEIADLALPPPAEGSAEVAGRVARARDIQTKRYDSAAAGGPDSGVRTNAEADGELLASVAKPDDEGVKLLTEAANAMRLSARGYNRVLRVARTLADLEAAPNVRRLHVAEALSYRRLGLMQSH